MITCTRKISFDAAHRIINHECKCKYIHGHRYVVDATFSANSLDEVGRVVDFSVIKEKLGTWINKNWDHNLLLSDTDKELGEMIERITAQKVFYLPYNPTVENIASYLFNVVCKDLFCSDDIKCVKIVVYETPNCYAEVS